MSVLTGLCQVSIQLIMSKQDHVTGMETCEFTYELTIKNFKQLYGKTIIESPSFSSHYSDFDDKWILQLLPINDGSSWKHVSMQLNLQSFNTTSQLQIKCELSINKRNEITKEHIFSKFPDKITWDKYISTAELLKPSNGYLQNDELKICCTIIMTKKLTNNSSDKISTIARQQLSEDWKKLLLHEPSADVTIKVGQKSFRAIKAILAIRSPVFAAMFNHEQFKENKKNEVVIEDIEEDVFEEFLHYIYTGESPNVKTMPMELLAVADKYQVDSLRNICEEAICKTIYVDTVASRLICSDRYNLKKLNEKCLKFMKENLRDVMANTTFKVYKKKYSELFVGILEELLLS